MRVFVVGASGVIGSARSRDKALRLGRLGAQSVVLDALDARAVREAVLEAPRPGWLARLIAGEAG
ncbi:MAG TPA: hypothetical protein VK510_06620 [Solirubrobacteraceae bacterium]|nr:hypothetical protein [Solirubrobacteraceae bacterium]